VDPTDSTARDEEDAISVKNNLGVTETAPVPALSQQYPPSISDKQQRQDLDSSIPDGGLRAWLNVLGGFLVLFASFGYTNAWGVYQAYYSQTIYRNRTDSEIAWVGSLQLCLFFLLALVAGPLFDSKSLASLRPFPKFRLTIFRANRGKVPLLVGCWFSDPNNVNLPHSRMPRVLANYARPGIDERSRNRIVFLACGKFTLVIQRESFTDCFEFARINSSRFSHTGSYVGALSLSV